MAQPLVKWAQREDKLFITIEVTDVQDQEIILKPEGVLSFKGKGGPSKEDYAVELVMNGEIDVEGSKQLVNANRLFFTLVKKESGPYWPRLLKDKTKQHWLKADFDKWKDEDDDDDEEDAKPDDYNMPGMEGFDMQKMMAQMGGMGGGAGGMPGMPPGMPPGMDFGNMGAEPEDEDDKPDSDDDDMPDLE
eukprot:CAMPEP_0182926996 /NCGR_PEP_ID=MMETSP0105_2-20130417/12891_1 /TAXON_ID=81532 ORGANISM="Acanthoeca-like sp., Strain 10tr" /NCGR_SAMPLE_ID=MMETSP0105_2 /ASSEMBLY_ACC=CAM_ASM_000205 /LENGTH=189 /DNA_ID=CAMNT_0025064919 /DNA_START=64 /DNA_END=633 /DNA_ORIENTATION=+